MIQIAAEQMKAISDRQKEAIEEIIQSRNVTLWEYRKLKKVLDSKVITRRDASAFLEYCYARVHFERYFNGPRHKAYAACCFCGGRDNLRKVENLKTGVRKWCCQTCRSSVIDPDMIDVPTARGKAGRTQKRKELASIRGVATDMVLMADDSSAGVVPHEVVEMAEEIMERVNGLLKAEAERGQSETSAAADVALRAGQVGCVEGAKNGC